MSTSTSPLSGGTYYIFADTSGQRGYIQFTDGTDGTSLTTGDFTGNASQQVRSNCFVTALEY